MSSPRNAGAVFASRTPGYARASWVALSVIALGAGCAADGSGDALSEPPATGVLDITANDAAHGLRATLDVDGRRYAIEATPAGAQYLATMRDPAGATVAAWRASGDGTQPTVATIDGQAFGDSHLLTVADTDDGISTAPVDSTSDADDGAYADEAPDVAADQDLETQYAASVAFLRREGSAPTGRALLALTDAAERAVAGLHDAAAAGVLVALTRPGLALRQYSIQTNATTSQSVSDETYAGCTFHVSVPARGDDILVSGVDYETVRAHADLTCSRAHPSWRVVAYVQGIFTPQLPAHYVELNQHVTLAHHLYGAQILATCDQDDQYRAVAGIASNEPDQLYMACVVRTVPIHCTPSVRP